jgi:small subunit ribosomal protein S16
MNKGAQPTESVAQLFKTVGTVERFERFKSGEPVETLLAEAETARVARISSSKTGR